MCLSIQELNLMCSTCCIQSVSLQPCVLKLETRGSGGAPQPSCRWSGASCVRLQIRCKGRGQAPQPDAVNEFCWSICAFNNMQQADRPILWTLVHCTHGFNRTGHHCAHLHALQHASHRPCQPGCVASVIKQEVEADFSMGCKDAQGCLC